MISWAEWTAPSRPVRVGDVCIRRNMCHVHAHGSRGPETEEGAPSLVVVADVTGDVVHGMLMDGWPGKDRVPSIRTWDLTDFQSSERTLLVTDEIQALREAAQSPQIAAYVEALRLHSASRSAGGE